MRQSRTSGSVGGLGAQAPKSTRLQRLLGHGHIASTLRYVHLARTHLTGTDSPLDLLDMPH